MHEALLQALSQGELHADSLIQKTGLSAPAVASSLMDLELKKRIVSTPGNRYRLA
jgi:predicted Rossmann fold nucleotide-binding protein DprA/Smf involved in DNA uptake